MPSLEGRSPDDVCHRYMKDIIQLKEVENCHIPDAGECNSGKQNPQDVINTVRMLNYFRYLTGLSDLVESKDIKIKKQQMDACLVMSINDMFMHNLDSAKLCLSESAKIGARSSNIFQDSRATCAYKSIQTYIDDESSMDLGHRRWILYPKLSEVAVGVYGQYSALRVFNFTSKGKEKPTFIAYPPPGPVPIELIYNYWSFSRKFDDSSDETHNMPRDTTVKVTCDGKEIPIEYELQNSSNRAMYSGIVRFQLSDKVVVGKTYTVSVQSKSENLEWKYVVKPVNCFDSNEHVTKAPEAKSNKAAIYLASGFVIIAVLMATGYILYKLRGKSIYEREQGM